MPKQVKEQPRKTNWKLFAAIGAFLVIVAIGLVVTRDKWSPHSTSNQATCTQQEVKPTDPFYDKATIAKDGKRYIAICVQNG